LIQANGKDSAGDIIKSVEPSESNLAQKSFEKAVQLAKKKQCRRALEELTGFLVRFPGDTNAEEALFLSGQCQTSLGNSRSAIETYTGLVARFPQGSKAPDALLSKATLHRKRGELKKYRETLMILQATYPDSKAAHRVPKKGSKS
jgi:TolA-binding protein